MPANLVALMYISDMSPELDDIDLIQIDYELTKNNAYHDTSGVVIFDNRQFFHFLEGEETVVDDCFTSVLRDNRHRNVRMVLKMNATNRLFRAWPASLSTLAVAKAHIAVHLGRESQISPLKDFLGFFHDKAEDDRRFGGEPAETASAQSASSTGGVAASGA